MMDRYYLPPLIEKSMSSEILPEDGDVVAQVVATTPLSVALSVALLEDGFRSDSPVV